MDLISTEIDGCYVIKPTKFFDERGWFNRIYCENELNNIYPGIKWVQINHSFTLKRGTIRGMHYQEYPNQEIKMVKCISGKIFDVIIDLRPNSNSYLKWISIELSALNQKMVLIPKGLAHGFQSLDENTEIIYFHSEFYSPNNENGVLYNDPCFKIKWPLNPTLISKKDKSYSPLKLNF